MQIVVDQPSRLVFEARNERLPVRFALAALFVTLLIAAPWRFLWQSAVQGGPPDPWDPMPSVLILAVGLYFIVMARGGTCLERLTLDREAGRIDWRHSHLLGLIPSRGHIDLSSLEAFVLEREPGQLPPPPAAPAKARDLRFKLTLKKQGSEAARLKVRVEGVGRVEQLAGLALRMGSAVGLGYSRIVRNDPFAYGIEVRKDAAPGVQALTSAGEGVESSRARATEVPAFDPARFEGSLKVTKWEPGREIAFRKGCSRDLLFSPLLLGVALPVLAWSRLPSLHQGDLLPRVVAMFMIVFTGLALGLVGGISLWSGLPRGANFDWSKRELTLSGPASRRVIPFSDVRSLDLRDRIYRHRNLSQYTTWYATSIRLSLKSADGKAPGDELLIDTVGSRDPTEPNAMARPLATELAAALGIAVHETPAESW
jgi:hypothetical protein